MLFGPNGTKRRPKWCKKRTRKRNSDFLKTIKNSSVFDVFEGLGPPKWAPSRPPSHTLVASCPRNTVFFRHPFRLCFFIKFWGPTREAQRRGTSPGKVSRPCVNIDFLMNIGAGAQVLTTFGTFGFPGPAEKDITSGNIVSQLTLSQLR